MKRFHLLVTCLMISAAMTPVLAAGYRTSVGSGADAIPVVVVSGTPYEMGQSYGSLMASEVNACLTGYLGIAQSYDPARYSNANLDAAWAAVEPYVQTRFVEEMQGLADGAGVSYLGIRRAHCIPLVSDYACSGVALWGAASANGDLYQIRNLDYETEAGLQNYPAIVVYIPETGLPHANPAFAGFVGSMAGMNAAGVALTEIGSSPGADYPFDLDGIPFFVMFRDILQDAYGLNDALNIITAANRIKKYHYVIGDGDEPAGAKVKAFDPNLNIWSDNDPTDELFPNVMPNVVYETMDNAAAWAHLNAHYGAYDSSLMIDLSRLVASAGGNLMNVVYDTTTREMWVAYAEGSADASQGEYVRFNLSDYLPKDPSGVGGYGCYDVIGSGDDQVTVLYTGGSHYEMGFWHGYLLRSQVQANMSSALAAAESEGITDEGWQYAIDSMWPYVSQDYLDEMQGLADGAGVPIELVWKMHALPDLSEYHCSAFAAMGAATKDGHCIQLRNLDYGLELAIQDNPVLTVYEPDDANRYVNVTFAGNLGVIAGMSYQHIPVSEMGDSFDYDNETLMGEPMPFVLKDVLEHATSYTEAENIVSSADRTSSLWYTASDPEEGQAGLMMTSPTIFNAYHLGDQPGGILPAIPDVIYGGYYNDRLYADLTANWGSIDPAVAIAISINNAMNSNLMNAVYDATTLEMWVAYAQGLDRAANRPYVYFDLNWERQPVADAQASTQTAVTGQTVAFSGAGSHHPHPNHSIVSYEWDWESDGIYDATGVTADHAFASADTHTVTLRVTDDFTPGNTATDTVVVAVEPATSVVANAGPDKIIAAGGSAVLEGSESGGLAPYLCEWSPATGLSDPSADQPTASPAATTTYTLTVTDDLGQTDSDSVTVTVASAVVANAGPDKIIAPGGSAVLEGSESGGLAPYLCEWSPATDLDDPNADQPTASPAATTTYTLTVTDDLGQTDSDSVTVTVQGGSHDVAVRQLIAPRQALVGDTARLSAIITNRTPAPEQVSVRLLRNGVEQQVQSVNLAGARRYQQRDRRPGLCSTRVEFRYTFTAADVASVALSVEAVLPGDADLSNNTASAAVTVKARQRQGRGQWPFNGGQWPFNGGHWPFNGGQWPFNRWG